MRLLLCFCYLFLHALSASADEDLPPVVPRTFMLSFDDGPLSDRTEKVLHALRQLRNTRNEPVRVAFFMLGNSPDLPEARIYHAPYEVFLDKGSMLKYPEIVEAVRKDGHYIGNHSTRHAWFHWPWLNNEESVEREIKDWEDIAHPPAGQPKLFRPPALILTPAVKNVVARHGYQLVLGHVVGDANLFSTAETVELNILDTLAHEPVENGPVLLIFHDTIATTYENLEEIVRYIQAQGHVLVDFDPALVGQREDSSSASTP